MGSKYLWILDNGHGGIIDGEYQTPGKRSPKWPDGSQLFEGEFNRAIVKRLMDLCTENDIDAFNLVASEEDVPLRVRTDRANNIFRKQIQSDGKMCIYVSIHANGFEKESANGWEVFTTVGETKSDKIATFFYNHMKEQFPDSKFRKDYSDGDVDKEKNFWVLKKTVMPAILTENFFMTNREECQMLLSEAGRDKIAAAHFNAILEIEDSDAIF